MTIDDATAALLKEMGGPGTEPTGHLDPQDLRDRMRALAELHGRGPDVLSSTEHTVTGPGGQFSVRALVPSADPRGVVVYYHGGGWVVGDVDGFDTLGRSLAVQANVTVVLVGYRLAPEDPFPAAVEDAREALSWVAGRAGTLPGARGPIVLAGDSAGANLAIVTALGARSSGPRVAATLLAYPVTDWDPTRASYLDPENQLLLTGDDMRWFFDQYVAQEQRHDPRISPLREPDLSGFPSTALAIAEHDPLRDEGEEFGDRLREAGVPVRQRLFQQQMHGFVQMVNLLPGSAAGIDWFVQFLNEVVLGTGALDGAGQSR